MLTSTYLALTTQGIRAEGLKASASAAFDADIAGGPESYHPNRNSFAFWDTLVDLRREFRKVTGSELEAMIGVGNVTP